MVNYTIASLPWPLVIEAVRRNEKAITKKRHFSWSLQSVQNIGCQRHKQSYAAAMVSNHVTTAQHAHRCARSRTVFTPSRRKAHLLYSFFFSSPPLKKDNHFFYSNLFDFVS